MNKEMKNYRGLGRGLESLLNPKKTSLSEKNLLSSSIDPFSVTELPDIPSDHEVDQRPVAVLAIEQLKSGRFQPREHFDDEALDTLAQSIKNQGLVQPIVVRKAEEGLYEIVAGERRWRAAKRAGIAEVAVVIRTDISDKDAMAVALIENIQREDLNAIEEAEGFQRLHTEFKITHEEIARIVGYSRVAVSNSLRLLNLNESVQGLVRQRKLSMGHVRPLLALEKGVQLLAANEAMKKELSVRKIESMVKQMLKPQITPQKHPEESALSDAIKIENMDNWQTQLSVAFGRPVKLNQTPTGKGVISIPYDNPEQLKQILFFCQRAASLESPQQSENQK